MRLLVTGGAGYIGSHLVLELLAAGHDVTVVDNLSTGHREALRRVHTLVGRPLRFVLGDIGDGALMREALVGIDAVLHLAAFKAVGESMVAPERYFQNNLGGMAALLASMEAAGVRRLIYSSSAAVYGTQPVMPVAEDVVLNPENPYALTKVQGEQLVAWMVRQRGWSVVSLRYFNPVGAHPSGLIGQPFLEGGSLVPRVLYALTQTNPVTVYGTDWPTRDGTCERDYIHICDLARAHVVALEGLAGSQHTILNVGTGRPHSVFEVLASCARAAGCEVPHERGHRRPGDMAVNAADPTRFERQFGYRARRTLDEMTRDAWNWWTQNHDGYR